MVRLHQGSGTKQLLVRPHDPRMWVALGNCFESLDRDNQARDCYKRASLCENADKETAWLRLARVFQRTGNLDAAATYYKQVLELDEQDRVCHHRAILIFL
jgi:anaphase-promoting complex subunit 8